MNHRPKIQRLVTPRRLQRRRHLNAIKRRRLDHQKEQKAEYECVEFAIYRFTAASHHASLALCSRSVLRRRRRRLLPTRHTFTRSERIVRDQQHGVDVVCQACHDRVDHARSFSCGVLAALSFMSLSFHMLYAVNMQCLGNDSFEFECRHLSRVA
jgi:hypothetical protein